MFDIDTGSLLSSKELNTGTINRISVKGDSNGIIGQFNTIHLKNARHFENFISVNFFGKAFYHPYLASVEMKVHILKLKNKTLNKEIGLYLSTSLSKSLFGNFSYGNQLSSSLLKNSNLYIGLPTKNNQPDFDYIATYIKTIQKLIIKDLVEYTNKELSAYQQAIENPN